MRIVAINYMDFEGFFIVVEYSIDGDIVSEDYFETSHYLLEYLISKFLLNNPSVRILAQGDKLGNFLNNFNNVL